MPTNAPTKRFFLGAAALLSVGLIGALAYMSAGPDARPASAPTPRHDAAVPTPPTPSLPADAFVPKTIAAADMRYAEETAPLSKVPNLAAVEKKYGLRLSAAQRSSLEKDRFLLVDAAKTSLAPGVNFDDMLNDFDVTGGGAPTERAPEDARFVTPDVVLHAYHKFFEATLEQLEQHELADALGSFLTDLQANLAAAAKTGANRDRYLVLETQIGVARALFENKSPAKPAYFEDPAAEEAYLEKDKTIDTAARAAGLFDAEAGDLPPDLVAAAHAAIANIYAADAPAPDPLFGRYKDDVVADYTQYGPRSHYAKNSALRAYFRAMMYLGRSSWFLAKDEGVEDAALLARQFAVKNPDGGTPLDAWKKIMAVTGFYAGQSDDLTYGEWQDYVAATVGAGADDAALAYPANVARLGAGLDKLRPPKILSDIVVSEDVPGKDKARLLRESLGFRVFGQRFTFDAWILNDLTAGQEKTDVRLPSTPSELFVPAAMGDDAASAYAGEFLKTDAGVTDADVAAFGGKLSDKRAAIGRVSSGDWFGSMGSAWLFVLGSLTGRFGDGYPAYMRAAAFADKQIQTFLGSLAELKHDTLLYAKQSYAELGAGGEEEKLPPVPKGFVEPNMEFWNRFNALVDRTRGLFADNGLFQDQAPAARLEEFKDISRFYAGLAEKELRGETIGDDEYEKLRSTDLAFMADPFDATAADEDSGKVALIADVHTDALRGQVLYEATARPYLMLAIVGNESSPRAVAGLAFDHYELTGPLGKRFTDEDWRARVYGPKPDLPPKNFWYASLLAK